MSAWSNHCTSAGCTMQEIDDKTDDGRGHGAYPHFHLQTQVLRCHLLCSARKVWWLKWGCPVSSQSVKLLSGETLLLWYHLRRMDIAAYLWKWKYRVANMLYSLVSWNRFKAVLRLTCHDGCSLPADRWVIFQSYCKDVLQAHLLFCNSADGMTVSGLPWAGHHHWSFAKQRDVGGGWNHWKFFCLTLPEEWKSGISLVNFQERWNNLAMQWRQMACAGIFNM